MCSVYCFKMLLGTIICLLNLWHLTDGSDIYTSYRRYTQRLLVRYHRAYTFKDLGPFRTYQSRYSYYVRQFSYYVQTSYSSTRNCENFEGNSYGDYIGYFDCPLSFEWRNATYCCGEQKSHYCCDDRSKVSSSEPFNTSSISFVFTWYIYVAIVIGCVFGGSCIFGVIYGVMLCCGLTSKKTTRNRVNATAISTVGSYPVQPGSGNTVPLGAYPVQTQVGFAQLPPAYPGGPAPPPAYPGGPAPPPSTAPPPYAQPYPPAGAPDTAYPPPAAYQQQ